MWRRRESDNDNRRVLDAMPEFVKLDSNKQGCLFSAEGKVRLALSGYTHLCLKIHRSWQAPSHWSTVESVCSLLINQSNTSVSQCCKPEQCLSRAVERYPAFCIVGDCRRMLQSYMGHLVSNQAS